jgi:hypothetical protein
MANIYLPDGSCVIILSNEDFQELIREKLGRDAETEFTNILEQLNDAKEGVGTDLRSYEASLESNSRCFNELLDIIAELKRLLQSNRLNRTQISKLINQMKTEIYNQI